MKAICRKMGREFAGALLRPYGWFFPELQRRGRPVGEVIEALKEAGAQIVREGRISEEVSTMVSQDLATRDEVLEYYNSR